MKSLDIIYSELADSFIDSVPGLRSCCAEANSIISGLPEELQPLGTVLCVSMIANKLFGIGGDDIGRIDPDR